MLRNSEVVKKLSKSQTKRLLHLLQMNPRQAEIEAFLDSCLLEETNPTSISRKIQNSQLRAALSWMDSNTLRSMYGNN